MVLWTLGSTQCRLAACSPALTTCLRPTSQGDHVHLRPVRLPIWPSKLLTVPIFGFDPAAFSELASGDGIAGGGGPGGGGGCSSSCIFKSCIMKKLHLQQTVCVAAVHGAASQQTDRNCDVHKSLSGLRRLSSGRMPTHAENATSCTAHCGGEAAHTGPASGVTIAAGGRLLAAKGCTPTLGAAVASGAVGATVGATVGADVAGTTVGTTR